MGAVYRLDGDAAGAVTAVGSVGKAFDNTDKMAAKAAQSAEKLEQRLKLAADKIKEAINPQEKLNRLYKELGDHVKAGRLTIEQATAAGVKWRQEMGLAARAADDAGRANDGAFGAKALGNITSYLTGLVSVGGAISIIKSELSAIAAIDERAAQRIAGAAPAEADLRRVVATDPQRDRVLATAKQIAEQNKLPLEGVFRAVTAAYGSTSDANLTLSTIAAAAQKTRDTSKLAETAAGIGFITQSSRIKDAVEAGGFIDQVLAISPIKDEKVPQALAKVVGSYVSPVAGGSEATAGTVLGLLSQAAADVEGDRSRTGAIQLEGKLDKFFAKNYQKFKLAKDASDGIDEQLSFLFDEKNIGAAKQFIESSTFEAPVAGGMATLFLDPAYRQRFRQSRPELASRDARLRAAADTARFVRRGDLQDANLTNDVVGSKAEEFDVARAKLGILTEQRRNELISLLSAATGQFDFQSRFSVFQQSGPSTTREEAISIIQKAQREFGPRELQGDEGGVAQDKLNAMLIELRGIRRQNGSKRSTRGE